MRIPFSTLTRMFPKDTVWANGCAEIVGYSAKKNMHIVIDDGQRYDEEGKWTVHLYHPTNPNHKTEWMPNDNRPWPLKCIGEGKFFEGRISFSDGDEIEKYRKMWGDL